MEPLRTKRDRARLLIVALGVAISLALSPFVSGLLGAAVLYVVCIEPYRRLARVLKPSVAAFITLTAAIVVIALPLTWLVGLVIDQAPDTLRSVQSSYLYTRIAQLRVGNLNIGAEIAKASGTLIQWFSGQAFDLVGSAARATLNLVIAFFGLYYMLHSGEQMWEATREYIPFSPRTADALRERFYGVTRATLLGTALTAAMQGALVGLAFWFVGLPSALFWGTVTAFASILPVLGSGLVWMPAVAVLLLQQRYGAAIVMLVMGWLIASNIDNLIRPMVYRRVSDIHPMTTLVGAFAGVKYFGLPGLLLGPLAIAYFFELLRFYREEYGTPDGATGIPEAAPG
jgi:predicted PurR-regulated permease PerM